MRRRIWRVLAVTLIGFVLIAGAISIIAITWLNPRLTRYIESDSFRAEMEKETAKGLHFPIGHYQPIKRTGTWTAESARFQAKNGWKAMRLMGRARDYGQVQPMGPVAPALAARRSACARRRNWHPGLRTQEHRLQDRHEPDAGR